MNCNCLHDVDMTLCNEMLPHYTFMLPNGSYDIPGT